MKALKLSSAVIGMGLLATACTATGNMERNAAGGAAAGAIVGAIIGNNVGDGDAETGALIGAVIGGAAGAKRGHDQDQAQGVRGQGYATSPQYGGQQAQRSGPNGEPLYFDRSRSRYYYVDSYGSTYWQNGERRS